MLGTDMITVFFIFETDKSYLFFAAFADYASVI